MTHVIPFSPSDFIPILVSSTPIIYKKTINLLAHIFRKFVYAHSVSRDCLGNHFNDNDFPNVRNVFFFTPTYFIFDLINDLVKINFFRSP